MLIRRETPTDIDAIRDVTAAAFRRAGDQTEPGEPRLVDLLRADASAWVPELSLVAIGADSAVIGHVLGTRGHVDGSPALALGPVSVHPAHQRRGVGLALMHTVLGAGDALGEPLVALLGSPDYYRRFGFRLASECGIEPPVAEWKPYFQVRTLSAYDPRLRGVFAYADAFYNL